MKGSSLMQERRLPDRRDAGWFRLAESTRQRYEAVQHCSYTIVMYLIINQQILTVL